MQSKVSPVNTNRLGALLQMLRNDKNLTRAQVAKTIGCSPAGLMKVETGKSEPRLRLLAALASLYGHKLSELMEQYEEVPGEHF